MTPEGDPFLPDRADFPFVTEQLVQGSPPVTVEIAKARLTGSRFQMRDWAAEWAAWLTLLEFASTRWKTLATVPAYDPTLTDGEIAALVQLAEDERADALDEIVAQHHDVITPFMVLLGITRASHPATYRLLHIAGLTGLFAAMHVKNQNNRPRPSQICPALLPPVPLPGHPSYPSGHATQSRLMVRCVAAVLPPAIQAGMTDALLVLANRIARNRQIAGLHYESDTARGQDLAEAIYTNVLQKMLSAADFQGILADPTATSIVGSSEVLSPAPPATPSPPSTFALVNAAAVAEWATP